MNGNNRNPERPEKNFRVGAVRAAVWKNTNTTQDGRKFETRRVVLDRAYKNGQEWKTTASLDVNDIPKAILALQTAYEYLMTRSDEAKGEQKEV